MSHPLQAVLYLFLGYLVLQILQNLLVRTLAQRSSSRAMTALKGSFWAGVINALYFVAAAVWLHSSGKAPNRSPDVYTKWWALAGLPLGVLLWYLSVRARGFGIRLFGHGSILSGEDAILQFPPAPVYISLGIANQTFLQPLGRELFLRSCLLPLTVAEFGWLPAVGLTVLVELAPRLNVVWLPLTLLHGLLMCLLFYLSGGALCGLITSAVSGCLHSFALAYASSRVSAADSASSR